MKKHLAYHHLGIPTDKPIPGEVYLEDYKCYHSGYEKSEFGIEWMRYEKDCLLPLAYLSNLSPTVKSTCEIKVPMSTVLLPVPSSILTVFS